jgi:hypothetical protein
MCVGRACMSQTFLRQHNILKHVRRYFYVAPAIKSNKRTPLITSCVWEQVATASCAVVSKNLGSMITFPLDSCRIYKQIGKPCTDLRDLYKGYWVVLATQTIQASFSYLAFFVILNIATTTYHKPIHEAIVFANLIASLVSSFVKVPLIFITRNIIFCHGDLCTNISTILQKITLNVYKQCWLTVVISEIPDTCIKTFLNFIVLYLHPSIDHLARNCIVSLITNMFTAPFDYIITHAFCKVYHGKFNIVNCYDGIIYKLFSCFIGQVVFYNTFNLMQPCKFY